MKRILFVTSRDPFAGHGGDLLRARWIIKSLSNRYKVDVFVIGFGHVSENVKYRFKLNILKQLLSLLFKVFSGTPLQTLLYTNKKARNEIKNISESYDLIICHLLRQYGNVNDLPNLKIYEATDLLSLNYKRKKNNLFFIIYRFESFLMDRLERKIIKENPIVFVSDFDVSKTISTKYISVVPNGVNVEDSNLISRGETRKYIGFVGNMNAHHNFEAVKWFVSNISPKVPFKIRVIGRMSNLTEVRLRRIIGEYGMVISNPSSITIPLNQCFVGVCPTQSGAGQQNKILDYLSRGLPALCSELSYNGLPSDWKEYAEMCTSIEEWVTRINKIFSDKTSLDLPDDLIGWGKFSELYTEVVDAYICNPRL